MTTHILDSIIPTSNNTGSEGYSDAENEIYDVIANTLAGYDATKGDKSFTIVYSVFDNAGNESPYIARGVIFSSLIPEITVTQNNGNAGDEGGEVLNAALQQVDEDTYYLNVEQGTDVNAVIKSLSVNASTRDYYLTQTIYHNGELVVDNARYNPNVYDGFNTNNPGLYEITYSLQYRYYGEDGTSELISAKPVKLVVNIESTRPLSDSTTHANYANIILLISLLAGSMFIVLIGILGKKRS